MGTSKEFHIRQSERSYRFKEEALYAHAPQTPGIYELVTFDAEKNPKVVYADWTKERSIFEVLAEHWRGERRPSVKELLNRYPNLYFSYVMQTDAQTAEDMQDLYWAIVQADRPDLIDPATVQPSGRYSEITVKDQSVT